MCCEIGMIQSPVTDPHQTKYGNFKIMIWRNREFWKCLKIWRLFCMISFLLYNFKQFVWSFDMNMIARSLVLECILCSMGLSVSLTVELVCYHAPDSVMLFHHCVTGLHCIFFIFLGKWQHVYIGNFLLVWVILVAQVLSEPGSPPWTEMTLPNFPVW